MFLALLCGSCTTKRDIFEQGAPRTIQGYTYDLVTGERLNGAFVINITQRHGMATDSIGRFNIIANVGDSIRFQYVGMKDSVVVLTKDSLSYWKVGLDTLNLIMTDKGVFSRHSP